MMAEFADRPAGQQAIQVTEATTLVFASFWPRAGRDLPHFAFGGDCPGNLVRHPSKTRMALRFNVGNSIFGVGLRQLALPGGFDDRAADSKEPGNRRFRQKLNPINLVL